MMILGTPTTEDIKAMNSNSIGRLPDIVGIGLHKKFKNPDP